MAPEPAIEPLVGLDLQEVPGEETVVDVEAVAVLPEEAEEAALEQTGEPLDGRSFPAARRG